MRKRSRRRRGAGRETETTRDGEEEDSAARRRWGRGDATRLGNVMRLAREGKRRAVRRCKEWLTPP